jgi:hypothetical protein
MRAEKFILGLVLLAILAWTVLLVRIEGHTETAETCMSAGDREYVRALLVQSLDKALIKHTSLMYEVWMKDSRDQPHRARIGVNSGVAAYMKAREGVMSWNPPAC